MTVHILFPFCLFHPHLFPQFYRFLFNSSILFYQLGDFSNYSGQVSSYFCPLFFLIIIVLCDFLISFILYSYFLEYWYTKNSAFFILPPHCSNSAEDVQYLFYISYSLYFFHFILTYSYCILQFMYLVHFYPDEDPHSGSQRRLINSLKYLRTISSNFQCI